MQHFFSKITSFYEASQRRVSDVSSLSSHSRFSSATGTPIFQNILVDPRANYFLKVTLRTSGLLAPPQLPAPAFRRSATDILCVQIW
jgi:hypothetical protein